MPEPEEKTAPPIPSAAWLRRKFSLHMIYQVAGGLRDDKWNEEAHAFIDWCYRLDNHKPTYNAVCQNDDCRHGFHESQPCGEPLLGQGFPYYQICLCGSRPNNKGNKEISIDALTLRFAFDWMDKAADLLRIIVRHDIRPEVKIGIIELLEKTDVNVMQLLTRGTRKR